MFPKITNYVELLSEDEVWDAVRNGKEINVLILEDTQGYIGIQKYQAGYIKAISDLHSLRTLIRMRKEAFPIIFIVWNSYIEDKKEEESDGESN